MVTDRSHFEVSIGAASRGLCISRHKIQRIPTGFSYSDQHRNHLGYRLGSSQSVGRHVGGSRIESGPDDAVDGLGKQLV
jgi:hypothetical protein